MSKLVTTPIRKATTGIKSAVTSPARFLVSFGIGFALGVIFDIAMEYIWWHGLREWTNDYALDVGFPFYYGYARTTIPADDLIQYIIMFALLFSKKFVFVLGLFAGSYCSSIWGLKQKIAELPA